MTFPANASFPKFRKLVEDYVSKISGPYQYAELRVEASVLGDEEIDHGIRVGSRQDWTVVKNALYRTNDFGYLEVMWPKRLSER